MADQIQLEGHSFYAKLQKIVETWNKVNDTKDALLVVMSKLGDGILRQMTSDFFVWLLNYDFPETIMLMTKERVVFAVSPKKKQLLEAMEVPMDYKGPELEILIRDIKQDNTAEVIEKVLAHIKVKPAKVGVFLKDQEDGDLTHQILKAVDARGFQKVEMKELMDKVNMTKIKPEIDNLRAASSFLKWTFDNVVGEVEDIIEIEKPAKHEAISKKVEGMLEDPKKVAKLMKEVPNIQLTFLDYPLGVLIQSGDNFTLNKFNVQSDSSKLNSEVVYINICGKFKDMHTMASRTLLVNPKDDQKKAYQIAFEAIDVLTKNLVPGKPIKNAYIATKDFIKEKDPNLASKVHTNFGFGIGTSIKEDQLLINETNETIVKHSMSFYMDEEEAKGNEKPSKQENGRDELMREAKKDLITGTRLREKNVVQHDNTEQRKKTQEQLLDKKLEELKQRYENGEITTAAKKEKVKKMGNIQSYENERQIPRDLKPGQLYVDQNHDTILIPVNNTSFVPFHISTIKNVAQTVEGQWTYLRLNFHIPGGSTLQFPPSTKANQLFVKELTLKNMARGGENHLATAFKQIRDMIKKAKDQDIEDSASKNEHKDGAQEELQLIKGKKETLENLVIRPNIIGKKTVGNLEIHQNGVRFSSTKGHNVDITFSNIKHAFFQPCAEDELIVIIHFHLKNPIQVGSRKSQDVQFFKEAGVAADDLDMKVSRRRLNDMDELEQEERERQQKIKLNNRFSQFVKLIEQIAEKGKFKLEFDIPFEDLDFYGCPNKSVVKVRPTKNCLIAISEFPFFVIDIDDIEVVHFERLSFGIKNFDMAIIFKDFTTFKRINSIPVEHIEDIKSYFDEIGIIYSESVVPMNWGNVLAQIRDDFEAFLGEGGWKFLQDDDEEGQEEEEEDEDEEFSVDSEEDYDESSESDYSDDDDMSESDFDSEEDLSEEGLSWDELDKQAEEEDRRAAVRRTGRDVSTKPQPQKRKPAGRR